MYSSEKNSGQVKMLCRRRSLFYDNHLISFVFHNERHQFLSNSKLDAATDTIQAYHSLYN